LQYQRFVARFVALLPRLAVDLVVRLAVRLPVDFDALVRFAAAFFVALLADFLAALPVVFFVAAFFVALAGFLVPPLFLARAAEIPAPTARTTRPMMPPPFPGLPFAAGAFALLGWTAETPSCRFFSLCIRVPSSSACAPVNTSLALSNSSPSSSST